MKKYKVTAGQTVLTKFQASSGKLQAASFKQRALDTVSYLL
jgi:hypothetical protein